LKPSQSKPVLDIYMHVQKIKCLQKLAIGQEYCAF